MSPKLVNVMTPFPYSISTQESIKNAKAQMREHGIRHLPVVDETRVIGILSERDIHLASSIVAQYCDDTDLMVGEVFVVDPYKVEIDQPLEVVLAELARRNIGSAIITKKGKLAGIVTMSDVCRAFAEHLAGAEMLDPQPPERA